MKRLLLIVLGALALQAFANTAPHYGEQADGFRPRCVAKPGSRDNIFFVWTEKEKTERRIWAGLRRVPCEKWKKAGTWFTVRSWSEMTASQDHVFGVRLSAATLEALRQVRYGATEIREEKTAAEWLKKHPIHTYTHGVNRHLTRRFGLGFSGDVYQAWVESRPDNAFVRDRYRYWFDEVRKDPDAAATLRKRMGGRKVLISLGMAWDPKTGFSWKRRRQLRPRSSRHGR